MASTYLAGSILVAPGTPRNVGTIAVTGNFQFSVNSGAMIDGDEFEIRIGNTFGVGGTIGLQYDGGYADRQAVQMKTSEPFTVTRTAMLDLNMTAGGARWFPYELVLLV